MFAGRLDTANLSLPQRAAVTLVRGLEGDFRDWADVRAWADGIADALHAAAKPPAPDVVTVVAPDRVRWARPRQAPTRAPRPHGCNWRS